ncbi:NTF2-like N-terminal transpeptidase domain-containing protein, partial [Brevibacillus sp. BC25]|uniref:NTF2-like N-terminal transpeptidase domain-containing protein n=1 Tax=Brevibacillus sp. BC25 TaxID=1144308 RepID=UPI00027146D0
MKKTWIVFWTVFVVVLSGFFYLFWDFWKDNTQSDGERAKTAFTAYTTKWGEQKFSDMYEQLSLHTKKTISKEEFVSRYQNIYGGIEAKAIAVEPMYNGDVMLGEDGQINFHYRLTMETFIEPISFTGKATLVKETQNDLEDWYIHWNPSFIFPEMKEGDKVRANTVHPRRGEITDRAGRPLATERVGVDIGINPGEWSQASQTGKMEVSKLLQIPLDDLTSKVQATTSKSAKFIRIATLPQDDARIKQLEKTEGLKLHKKKVRYYPYQDATAHLVGYVGAISQEEYEKRKDQGYKTSDVIGKSGLEQIFEEQLRGSAGGRIVITDPEGTEKKTVAERFAKHGKPLALTIDAEIQKTIYQELKNEAGTASAISPKTGEILALVNSPSFDPNAFVLGMSATEWKQMNENPQKPLLNRFARGFAPGSTFKPITAAIGLESGA